MRAVVQKGGQTRVVDNYRPPQPGPDEALVEVIYAGICATDLEITRGYLGFEGVLGHEFVGRVVEGPAEWVGRRVVGEINCVCGRCDMCQRGLATHCRRRTVIGISGRDGCFAERLALPVRNLHAVPDSVSDVAAVFTEPLAAAIQVLKQVPIDTRTRAAVVGSGRLGLLVAQVLRTAGCRVEVIGRNPRTLEFCEKHGIEAWPVEQRPPRGDCDVVVEATGNPAGLEVAQRLVRPRGTIVLKSTYAGGAEVDLAPAVINEITLLGSRCGPFPDALAMLARREVDVETMVTRMLPLEQALEALRLAETPEHIKVLLRIGA